MSKFRNVSKEKRKNGDDEWSNFRNAKEKIKNGDTGET